MKLPACLVRAVVTGCALAALPALCCAQASGWRSAVVQDVTVLSRVPGSVDTGCVHARPADADPRVVVVAYRATRARYWRAFALAPDAHVRVGEAVRVEPASCDLRIVPPPAGAASAPFSAPF